LPKQTKKQNRRVQKRWDKYLARTTLTKANSNSCADAETTCTHICGEVYVNVDT
jgi:hypothetical protein